MLETSYTKLLIEAGCDEAGRGCLAGSLFAAAVILPSDFYHPLLNDSKKMTPRNRETLREIIERESIAWAVGEVEPSEIDRINILNASFLGMTRAVEQLNTTPELLLIDGNRFRSNLTIPHHCIVKGDSKFASIAAASVLAKTYRDEYITKLAKEYPHYQWHKNMAYPTKEHKEAIEKYGICKHHRLSFGGLGQLTLELD